MALDWLLLDNFSEPDSLRLRCYGWANPACTFGYGQKWAEAQAASNEAAELIRRPTGGGLVDHRHDWTYALVIPAAHPLAQARACESYRVVHEALSAALTVSGVPNHLQPICPSTVKNKFSICFHQPERFDLVRSDSGQKIAGAAQKRTRKGLLLQGTVDRRLTVEIANWQKFGEGFAETLAKAFKLKQDSFTPPSWFDSDTLDSEIGRFASNGWNQRR